MKRVTKRYSVFLTMIIGLMILVLVLGCARRGGEWSDEQRPIQILSTVSYETISKGIVAQNTALSGVRFLKVDGEVPASWAVASPFYGNRAIDGSIVWQGVAPTYDRTDKSTCMVAYHPSVTETANEKVDWVVDGKTDIVLSEPWDAGKYSAPKTGAGSGETPLTFDHVLAQLSVVFRADSKAQLATIQTQYGRITGVKFYQALPKATYDYTTGEVTFSGTPTDRALWHADGESVFAPMAVPASNNTASNAWGVFAPMQGTFVLVVSTEKFPVIPVVVQLTEESTLMNFEAGRHHTVTLQFKEQLPVVSVVGTSIGAWNETRGSGAISGGVTNEFVLQLLEPQAMGYDYTQVKQVRLTAAGIVYDFPAVTFVGSSNVLVATTNPFSFTTARPDGYPYTVERIELLDALGVAVGSASVGVFDADVMVTRGGMITIQLLRGKATDLISSTGFLVYGTLSSTDAPLFTGTVTRSPVELVYALGDGTPALGKEATAVSKAVVTVRSSSGTSSLVVLSPYTMVGTPLVAHSSGVVDMVLSSGWPSGLRYPYEITHVALYDRSNNVLVPTTALSTPLEVYWHAKTTLSVTQAVAPVVLKTEGVVYGLAAQSSVRVFTVTAPVGVKWRLSSVALVSGAVLDFALLPSSEQTGTGSPQPVTFSCKAVASGAFRTGSVNVLYGNWFGTSMSDPVAISHGANVSIAPAANWTKVSNAGGSREVIVTVAGASTWTASVSNLTNGGLTVSPTSGVSGSKATITWAAQVPKVTPANPARSGTVTFSSNSTVTSTVMTTDQLIGLVVNPPAASDYVKIGSLYWATGNLVANGKNGCKVGASTDHGLHFQFGSLIGWKGGAVINGGTGVGSNPYMGSFWGGSKLFSWANDVMVYPAALSGNPSKWPKATEDTAHQWYFSGKGAPTGNINVTDATKGVGDPCAYYLGNKWRLPTNADYKTLYQGAANGVPVTIAGGSWGAGGVYLAGKALFFPASGVRQDTGVYSFIGTLGYYWSRSFLSDKGGGYMSFSSSLVYPDSNGANMSAFPVRCVSSAP